jgi:hypothetical protein
MSAFHKGADIMSVSTMGRVNLPAARRSARPERVDLGDDVAVRNDIIAKEQGRSERAVNSDDAQGAPFLYLSKVKYRPIRAYRLFLASKIQVRNQKRRGSVVAKKAGRP